MLSPVQYFSYDFIFDLVVHSAYENNVVFLLSVKILRKIQVAWFFCSHSKNIVIMCKKYKIPKVPCSVKGSNKWHDINSGPKMFIGEWYLNFDRNFTVYIDFTSYTEKFLKYRCYFARVRNFLDSVCKVYVWLPYINIELLVIQI